VRMLPSGQRTGRRVECQLAHTVPVGVIPASMCSDADDGIPNFSIFTRATLAIAAISADIAVVLCLSLRLLQVGVLLKRLNVGSCKQRHTMDSSFSSAENLGKTQTGSSPTKAPNAGGVG